MKTEVLNPNKDRGAILLAARLLKNDEIVGIPTETVYGLAANAFSPRAVNKIFEAKGRPSDNPLIIHISNYDMWEELVTNIPDVAKKLAHEFWPGSLTIILPCKNIVPRETNGGLNTVGVRMPRNKITLDLIEKCGFPLAAPSANISGSPSPTSSDHVYKDMNGRIPLILDGGMCEFGLESTVITFSDDKIKILRPGAVTPKMLGRFGEVEIDKAVVSALSSDEKPISPGTKYMHYSPNAEVVMVKATSDENFNNFIEKIKLTDNKKKYALIFNDKIPPDLDYLTYGDTEEEQAKNLFAMLRELDSMGAEKIYVRAPSSEGVGLAVYNRLIRAAGFNIIET